MKIILASIFILLFPTTTVSQTIYVNRVVDGDTFEDSTSLAYRLIGINAPEKHEKGGAVARYYLDSLIKHKNITLKTDINYDTIDFYKRKLCYLVYNDEDINKKMIYSGHAVVYTKYPFSKLEEYLQAQNEYNLTITANFQPNRIINTNDSKFETSINIRIFIIIILVIILTIIGFYYYNK